ncbi:DNA-binding response regulator [bacterium D16-76]|nr:DNA-binding response regulator [bacterium D16-76]
MRILACDDDKSILSQLEACLLEYFETNALPQPQLCFYPDGHRLLEAEAAPGPEPASLAFLDVEMPGLTGIDVGARLMAQNPYMKIFIVTSYPDYLDDAMRFHVFRYLSKPIDKARLFRNLKEALCQLAMDTRPVLIETAQGAVTRRADEIVMVESEGRHSAVQAVDGLYHAAQPMGHWEKALLPVGSFYKPHRSYLVNMKYVRRFTSALITLCGPDGAPYTAYLTRRRYKDFKNTYMLYVEAMR